MMMMDRGARSGVVTWSHSSDCEERMVPDFEKDLYRKIERNGMFVHCIDHLLKMMNDE